MDIAVGIEEIRQTLLSQIEEIDTNSLGFLFSPQRRPYLDLDTITASFEEEWASFRPALAQKNRHQAVASLLHPAEPYGLNVLQRLQEAFPESASHRSLILMDLCIGKILTLCLGRYREKVSPQLLLELLNRYKLRGPEFLIAIGPLTRIILEEGMPSNHIIRSHACEVLVNNYEVESILIYMSCMSDLGEGKKQTLFQSITAFQKIYRKLLELYVGVHEKDLISRKWFGISFGQLKQQREWRDSFSNLVRRYVEYLTNRNKADALDVGRFLVLRFNNEDTLRVMHYEIGRNPDISSSHSLVRFVYRQVFQVMQDFRKQYISQKVDTEVTQTLSRTEAEAMDAMRLVTVGKVPASVVIERFWPSTPSAQDYPIITEFMETLDKFNLKALLELHSIPPISQEAFNLVAEIADSANLGRDELFHFITYLENLLTFLQDLDALNIKIEKTPAYGLSKNPYQLKLLGLINEGAYFASTGLWYQNTIPPSVIRCIGPNAIPNCLGIKDRHIFSRISLLTGGFRGNPFDLDSTNRYDWDEEPETCLFRPGYFQIAIPQSIRYRWEETQKIQKAMLKELIREKQWS
jgi:hypothetical protein